MVVKCFTESLPEFCKHYYYYYLLQCVKLVFFPYKLLNEFFPSEVRHVYGYG